MTANTRVGAILRKAIASYAGPCWILEDREEAEQAVYAGLSDCDIEDAMRALGYGFDHPDSETLYAAAQEEAKKRAGEPVAVYYENPECAVAVYCGHPECMVSVFEDGSLLERTNAGRAPWAYASDFLAHILNDCGVNPDSALVRFLDAHCWA